MESLRSVHGAAREAAPARVRWFYQEVSLALSANDIHQAHAPKKVHDRQSSGAREPPGRPAQEIVSM
jgi:hypothetical protein